MEGPMIVGFVCRWVTDRIDELVEIYRQEGVLIYQLNCVANLPASMVANILSRGVDVAFMLACSSSDCRYYEGAGRVERARDTIELMLEDMAVEPERLVVAFSSGDKDDPIKAVVEECRSRLAMLEEGKDRSELTGET